MITEVKTKVYAGRLKDKKSLLRSSSGGAFVAISDHFLDNGDAVVCAVYNYESHVTEFQLMENKEDRDKAIGSKYMQSKPEQIYKAAEEWLKGQPEKKLLFVGMGCQADGFRKFAEIRGFRERVCVVDIICHGSPSPKLWREYAESIEKKNGKITYLTFKDKRNGWKAPTAFVTVAGYEYSIKDYVKVFYNRCALRPSCYMCPYATIERKTDMTIGDFWHIDEMIPDFYDENGNSLFLIHTDQGEKVFDDIKESLAPNFKGGEKSFASRAYSDGKNKMMKGRLEPGASIGLHRHEGNCEMIYVLEGSGKMLYDGGEERLSAGDFHYCPEGHEHSFINDGDSDLVFIAVVPAQ